MKNLFKTLTVVAVMMLAGLTAQAQTKADDILGIWWNQEKTSKIEVYKNNGKYFGKIIHLEEPNDEQGKPKVDKDNPEAKLRTRPLLGMVILQDLAYDEDNEYEDGNIYDPKSGKTYSANAELVNKNQLDLRGYVGISLIGRTSTWTRASK